MDFHLAYALLVSLWCLRLLRVNDRLRKADPWDVAWQRFERRQLRDPRHPSTAPRPLP